MKNETNVINHPKPFFKRLFCKHEYEYFKKQEPYLNLSGETQYCICTKCGKRNGNIFVRNQDGS